MNSESGTVGFKPRYHYSNMSLRDFVKLLCHHSRLLENTSTKTASVIRRKGAVIDIITHGQLDAFSISSYCIWLQVSDAGVQNFMGYIYMGNDIVNLFRLKSISNPFEMEQIYYVAKVARAAKALRRSYLSETPTPILVSFILPHLSPELTPLDLSELFMYKGGFMTASIAVSCRVPRRPWYRSQNLTAATVLP